MRRSILLTILLTSLIFSAAISNPPQAIQAQSSPENISEPDQTNLYLPIVRRQIGPSIFGAETYDFTDQNFRWASRASIYWIRSAIFDWAAIESVRGTYNWSSVNTAAIAKISKNGNKLIATVKYTPTWAQKLDGYYCGPIEEDAMSDFYQFVYTAVQRYSVPPYNIQYWEFGNEPDVDPLVNPSFSKTNVFGCWGDSSKADFGGGYYANMLTVAYQAVKAADTNSKVLLGGLLLVCDPTQPSNGECREGKFFEGILNNGGGNNFDIVSFHSYVVQENHKILDEDNPKWINRHGQITGKINYLREVMAAHNINKPILLSELAMKWCDNCGPPTEEFLSLQADVVVTSYARTWGMGLLGETWFTLEDTHWLYSALFMGTTPKPAYYALVFMTKELHDCSMNGELSLPTGLRGYEFNCPYKHRRIQIIWTWDSGAAIQMAKPAGLLKMYDKLGGEITDPPDPLSIVHPVYLEFEN